MPRPLGVVEIEGAASVSVGVGACGNAGTNEDGMMFAQCHTFELWEEVDEEKEGCSREGGDREGLAAEAAVIVAVEAEEARETESKPQSKVERAKAKRKSKKRKKNKAKKKRKKHTGSAEEGEEREEEKEKTPLVIKLATTREDGTSIVCLHFALGKRVQSEKKLNALCPDLSDSAARRRRAWILCREILHVDVWLCGQARWPRRGLRECPMFGNGSDARGPWFCVLGLGYGCVMAGMWAAEKLIAHSNHN